MALRQGLANIDLHLVKVLHTAISEHGVSRAALTTGRLFCTRYVDAMDLRIVRCPVPFPPLTCYQLWHERTHAAPALRWLRGRVRDVARGLQPMTEKLP